MITIQLCAVLLCFTCGVVRCANFTHPDWFSLNYGLYCEFQAVAPLYALKTFDSTLSAVQPVTIEANNLIATYPPLRESPPLYRLQGTRGMVNPPCAYCPYDSPLDGLNKIAYGVGGVPFESSPMYGPCLDLARSLKVACVQNTLFYPPTFVGEYYYPDQSVLPRATATSTNPTFFAEHGLIANENFPPKRDPTNMGLGKQRVLNQLADVVIKNTLTELINETLTTQFKVNYTTGEGWLLWAQHQCAPGCHRNAQYQSVKVRESDWLNKSPVLQFLNRRDVGGAALSPLIRCQLCPPHHASYWWSESMMAPSADYLGWNAVAQNCYPWFGALPVLDVSNNFVSNASLYVTHGELLDGVLMPASNTYYANTPCPVDTYNDVCAHTIRHYARVASSQEIDASFTPAAAAIKARCKPCSPAGYHTDGRTGAWFCLPPAGKIFSEASRAALLGFQDAENHSTAWSRRDKIGYEFECGFLPEHCKQCAAGNLLLPDDFNQQMILSPMLAVEACPQGMYCPHPLRTAPVRCPASKPWSPAGSFSISQCTCAKGTFLSLSDQCTPCLLINSCSKGQYLSGWTHCMTRDGMTSPGQCVACTNVPPNAVLTGTTGGIEYSYAQGASASALAGVCPFVCPPGNRLNPKTDPTLGCATTWECVPVSTYVDGGGALVYSPNLQGKVEALTVSILSTDSSPCVADHELGTKMKAYLTDPGAHLLVSTQCLQLPGCSINAPCYVTKDATYASDVQCSQCASPPLNAVYTDAARYQSTATGANRLTLCGTQCGSDTFYVNKTANACQSCEALSSRVCVQTVPSSYQIRGGGCFGNFTYFPSSALAVASMTSHEWCFKCGRTPPAIGSGFYLDLVVDVCVEKPCPSLNVGAEYFKTPCGLTSPGEKLPCTKPTQCERDHQFLKGTCTASTTPVCTNCTTSNPGYNMTAKCSGWLDDTLWSPCPVGYTCAGGASLPAPCPYPKTSLESSAIECFCPAGMYKSSTGACVYQQCPDKTIAFTPDTIAQYGRPSPGDTGLSAYYMQLSTNRRENECVSCPLGSKTLEEHAVGVASCRCPFDYYMSSGMCTACSTDKTQCPSCWQGTAICSNAPAFPPFSSSFGMCASGFEGSGSGGATGTGSAAYVTEADSRSGGWSVHYDTLLDSITHMGVTSAGDGSKDAIQAVFFVRSSRYMTVFVHLLPSVGQPSVHYWCPIGLTPSLIPDKFKMAQLAVSAWPLQVRYPTSTATFTSAMSATVAMVAYNLELEGLFIYVNSASMLAGGTMTWSTTENTDYCGVSQQSAQLLTSFLANQTSVPALQHQFAYPGGVGPSSTFYVAINELATCSVIAYNVENTNKITTLSLGSDSRQITAMAVLASPSYSPVLYVAFDTIPDRVRMLQWTGSGSNNEIDEIFISSGTIVSLSQAWATDQQFWARVMRYVVTTDTSVPRQFMLGSPEIQVSDKDYQRTFTFVQNMPASTHPSIGPFAVAAGPQDGWLLSAHGSQMFSLPIKRCPTSVDSGSLMRAQYRSDLGTCTPHSCTRPRSCSADNRQDWNRFTGQCVCKSGYYATQTSPILVCAICVRGFYCAGNTKTSCDAGLTSNAMAQTKWDCVCALGWTYSTVSGSCLECAAGSWCPNQWDAYTCPGRVDLSRTTSTGKLYPSSCNCAAGFTGPGCTPCPSGFICPAIAQNTITNYVLSLRIMYTNNSSAPCVAVEKQLLAFFLPTDVNTKIYCTFLQPSTQRTLPMVVALIQTTGSSQAEWLSQLSFNATSEYAVVSSQTTSDQITNNIPILCSKDGSKSPTSNGASCQCAPGWRTTANSACAACEPNTFKALAGPSACAPCPSGMTSPVSSSACAFPIKLSDTNGTSSTSDSSAMNIPAIVGGVVGGIILLALILFALNQFYTVPAETVVSIEPAPKPP